MIRKDAPRRLSFNHCTHLYVRQCERECENPWARARRKKISTDTQRERDSDDAGEGGGKEKHNLHYTQARKSEECCVYNGGGGFSVLFYSCTIIRIFFAAFFQSLT